MHKCVEHFYKNASNCDHMSTSHRYTVLRPRLDFITNQSDSLCIDHTHWTIYWSFPCWLLNLNKTCSSLSWLQFPQFSSGFRAYNPHSNFFNARARIPELSYRDVAFQSISSWARPLALNLEHQNHLEDLLNHRLLASSRELPIQCIWVKGVWIFYQV